MSENNLITFEQLKLTLLLRGCEWIFDYWPADLIFLKFEDEMFTFYDAHSL